MKKLFFKKPRIFIMLILFMSVFSIVSVSAQQKKVAGTVIGTDGKTLPGVSVSIKGTTAGVLTDIDGKFDISVSDKGVLVFSFIGLETAEVPVNGQSQINLTLKSNATTLDEVVVVGYGTVKKSDLTGSLSSVSSRDFEQQPLTRIDQALEGRAAGVSVTQTSGAPGSGFKIRIRGVNSISGNNAPLYVVDGLVVGDINTLNVNDIASMEVLKDASATAIYGSRGANGVVLITTKVGKKGPAKIEFETFLGSAKVVQELKLMSPAEFAAGVNYAEGKELFTPAAIDALRAGGGENWQKRFFKTAPSSNAQLAISGAGDKVDYFISGNLYNADGTIIDQNYKRYTLRSNINAQISDKAKIGLNAFFSKEKDSGVRANLADGLSWDPTTPAFNASGAYNYVPLIPGVGNGSTNQLVAPQNNVRDNFQDQIIANTYFNYQLFKNLTLNVSGGLEQIQINNNSYASLVAGGIGNAIVLNRKINRYQNTNRLTYLWDQNKNHRIQIDAIHEQQYVTNIFSQANASGFFSDNTTYKNLGLGSIQRTTSSATSEGLQSFLGRVNYSAFNKYLFTASLRTDGSSKFREGNRWGIFPSGSIAWRVSEENFLKNNSQIDNLKVRVSYGVTGSQAIGPLATRSIPVIDPSVNYPFTGGTSTIGVGPSNRLANPDLTWETTAQSNAGFDLGLFDSKITLNFDAYSKRTTDLLLQRLLPSFVGPTVVTQNVGEVENKGFDINLGLTLIEKQDFSIRSNLSFSRNRNKVIKLLDGNNPLSLGNVYYDNTFPVNPTRVEVGKPISTFRGYQFDGVYQLGQEAEAAKFGRKPGDAKYRDINGDGKISTDDITTVGDGNPNFTWGWNWTIKYKNLDVNFLFLGSQGNEIYNFQYMKMMGLGAQQFHAVHADYLNRWTPTNPSNIPAKRDGTQFLSSQFIEDGSYVSLKNIAIGYNFNDKILKRVGINALRLFVNADNLLLLTKYSGFDPVTTASGGSDVDLGIDYNAYPISKSFTGGVKIIF